MTDDISPLLLSIPQTARLLGVGRSAIYKMFADGRLRRIKLGGSARIRAQTVRDLIHHLDAESTSTSRG